MVRFNPIDSSMTGKNGFPTYPAGKVPAPRPGSASKMPALTIVADS